ncbi:MAG TPA: beta-glucosidase BglX [Candidatus Acidoferrum sp.]|nr:beta-glucosidase BglX [Candidatus Acidoferrum sp.]
MNRHLAAVALCLAVLPAWPQPAIESRIDALLARMTLEEKIGQMSQSTAMNTLTDAIKAEIRAGRWGSFLNAGSPADRAEAQRIATTESRLRIPLIFGRDVIHGYKTIFLIPLGQAATWDPDVVEQAARVAGYEASAEGIHWTFAPMLDIARDPRWGRVAESLGEDPRLASTLGAAMVRGFQGTSLSDAQSLAACAKHFVGYGAAEAGRDYNSAWIPEILLREVYFPPFRAALDAGAATFMTAFNTLNGVPATGNAFLFRQVLRDEWRYDGMVVSDYEAVTDMIRHGYAADARDAARKALDAGVDMEMVSTAYFDHLKSLVERGDVTIAEIDGAVRNILRLKFRKGLFDHAMPAPSLASPTSASLEVARRVAVESIVLLKNDGSVLPLAASQAPVAVIGPLADSPADQMGTWSMDGRPDDMRTPLAALRESLGADRVVYAPGLRNSRDNSHDGFAAAVEAARKAAVVLLFLGEESILSGEARSRAFIDLPGVQQDLVDAVRGAGKPIVTIIMAGRPLTFHHTAEESAAVLYAWHPGAMGGPAIADLLYGRAAPSGRLPITFPRTVGQVPIYYSHLSTGRPASASELGIPMGNPAKPEGYTSKYIDVDFTPEYAFGFGLTYSHIEYSKLRLSAPVMRAGGALTVTADIANTGTRAAVETVQLYIHEMVASVAQPVRKLTAFRRVALAGGERRSVDFTLTPAELAFYDSRLRLVTEPGRFQVWIAPDSISGPSGEFDFR